MKIKDFFWNIVTSGKSFEDDEMGLGDMFIRYMLLNLGVIGGIFLLAFFAVESALKGSLIDALLNSIMALLFVVCVVSARLMKRGANFPFLFTLPYFPFVVALIINGDVQGYGFVWIYVYPLLSMILLGQKPGTVLSCLLLIVVTVVVSVPGLSGYRYSFETGSRLILAYVMVLAVTVIFEISRMLKGQAITKLTEKLKKERDTNAVLKEKADAASEAKSAFLANTSHEIRTPMNAVIGMAELALRKGVSPDVREDILSIRQAGQNLLSIINDILDFSKIESGKMEIVPVEYAISSLINDCLSIIKMRLYEKELLFTADIDSALPNKLLGDETRVRQVTLNLLSNAVKYTKAGSITLGIHGENTGKDSITLRIEVRDTGIGIKAEDMGKLFGEFNQFDSHKNRGVEGTGLGLAISRQLCRLMGGDITVESEYGKGSVFTAVIPQQVIDPAPFKLAENPASLEEKWSVQFTAPDAKILIVDDVETNLKIVSGLLALYQTDITTVTSGEAAIELVKKSSNGEQFDFILMDHMMPGMDGIEATAAIRALDGEYFKTVPIIALTANAVSGMKEMYLKKGFNDYLSKPIEIAKLDTIMEKWVPREKQKKGTGDWGLGTGENAGKSSEFPKAAISNPHALILPGVDTAKGIAMTGGTEAGYRKVLSMFCKDVEERLAFLRKVPEEKDLPLFTTQVHALKSVAGSIGAAELSAQAAELEAAGNAGNTAAITEKLPTFAEKLATLTEAIKKATTSKEEKITDRESAPSVSSVVNPLLGELAAALETKDLKEIDRLLAEIEKAAADTEMQKKIETISDHVLMGEFEKALAVINMPTGGFP